jgi:hypothetical protein
MKKMLLAVALCMAMPVFAAGDSWTMTGVMAVYPGTVNEPFSAPIVNPTQYKSKGDCDDAIIEIASTQPILVMINNGVVLPPQTAACGYVAVAASCN